MVRLKELAEMDTKYLQQLGEMKNDNYVPVLIFRHDVDGTSEVEYERSIAEDAAITVGENAVTLDLDLHDSNGVAIPARVIYIPKRSVGIYNEIKQTTDDLVKALKTGEDLDPDL